MPRSSEITIRRLLANFAIGPPTTLVTQNTGECTENAMLAELPLCVSPLPLRRIRSRDPLQDMESGAAADSSSARRLTSGLPPLGIRSVARCKETDASVSQSKLEWRRCRLTVT